MPLMTHIVRICTDIFFPQQFCVGSSFRGDPLRGAIFIFPLLKKNRKNRDTSHFNHAPFLVVLLVVATAFSPVSFPSLLQTINFLYPTRVAPLDNCRIPSKSSVVALRRRAYILNLAPPVLQKNCAMKKGGILVPPSGYFL
jgi:hypothetical protein